MDVNMYQYPHYNAAGQLVEIQLPPWTAWLSLVGTVVGLVIGWLGAR